MKKLFLVAAFALTALAASSTSAATCPSYPGEPCNGGPSRGFNVTTQQWEMVPQCFPWVWLTDYFSGNIVAMYQNQNACREQRKIDFGM